MREKRSYLEFLWFAFSLIWTKYADIRSISPYSLRMRENADQKSLEYEHFSRNVSLVWSESEKEKNPYLSSVIRIRQPYI